MLPEVAVIVAVQTLERSAVAWLDELTMDPQPPKSAKHAAAAASDANRLMRRPEQGIRRSRNANGSPAARVAPAAAMVTVTAVVPEGETACGMLQEMPAGRPAQLNWMAPAKPFNGVIESSALVLEPAVSTIADGPVSEKSATGWLTLTSSGADVELSNVLLPL